MVTCESMDMERDTMGISNSGCYLQRAIPLVFDLNRDGDSSGCEGEDDSREDSDYEAVVGNVED